MIGRSSAVFLLVALLSVFVLAGCSKSKKPFALKGSVTYQGKPLTSGMIRLHMADNRAAIAMIHRDGSFEATEVFAGEAKVTVEDIPGMKQQLPKASKAPVSKRQPSPPISIPAKYKDVNTSDLVFTLVRGQPLDIQLP